MKPQLPRIVILPNPVANAAIVYDAHGETLFHGSETAFVTWMKGSCENWPGCGCRARGTNGTCNWGRKI